MRTLIQPGPVHPARFDSLPGEPLALDYTLTPGLSLNEALTAPLVAAGMQSATVTFGGGGLAPFRYVMPGPPDSALHVAYFTAPRAPAGETRVDAANATFGWDEGKPYVHIHGAWTEADGSRHGGHMLPHDCIVAREMPAHACGICRYPHGDRSRCGDQFHAVPAVRRFDRRTRAACSRASGRTRTFRSPSRPSRNVMDCVTRRCAAAWAA